MRSIVWRMAVALSLLAPAVPAAHTTLPGHIAVPDFSGHWKLDAAKSAALAREAKGNTAAVIFGDECVITQTADALILYIVAGGLKVEVTYRLDGKPSSNTSPGARGQADIPIVSTTRWVGDTLEITTKSESELGGIKVPVESLRKIWLTPEGHLAVERRGTPTQVVSDAWSVYQRVKTEPGA